ncbi:hypothetical protein AB0E01_37705, partial [Nocardia vinacea]
RAVGTAARRPRIQHGIPDTGACCGLTQSLRVRSPRRLESVGATGGLMIIGVGASVALSGTN